MAKGRSQCLYCGTKLPLYLRLSNGEFCSGEHRAAFAREQQKVALDRLFETERILSDALEKRPDLPDALDRGPIASDATRRIRPKKRMIESTPPQAPPICKLPGPWMAAEPEPLVFFELPLIRVALPAGPELIARFPSAGAPAPPPPAPRTVPGAKRYGTIRFGDLRTASGRSSKTEVPPPVAIPLPPPSETKSWLTGHASTPKPESIPASPAAGLPNRYQFHSTALKPDVHPEPPPQRGQLLSIVRPGTAPGSIPAGRAPAPQPVARPERRPLVPSADSGLRPGGPALHHCLRLEPRVIEMPSRVLHGEPIGGSGVRQLYPERSASPIAGGPASAGLCALRLRVKAADWEHQLEEAEPLPAKTRATMMRPPFQSQLDPGEVFHAAARDATGALGLEDAAGEADLPPADNPRVLTVKPNLTADLELDGVAVDDPVPHKDSRELLTGWVAALRQPGRLRWVAAGLVTVCLAAAVAVLSRTSSAPAGSAARSGQSRAGSTATIPRVTGPAAPGFLESRWRVLQSHIAGRAGFESRDDFRSGFGAWQSRADLDKAWRIDETGFVLPSELGVYQPSMGLSDYTFTFLGEVDTRALAWAFRVRDPRNYYAAKLVVQKGTPLPVIALRHYAVIDGRETSAKESVLPLTVRGAAMFEVRTEVSGPDFTVYVGDRLAGNWSDARIQSGGIGFFSNRGEVSRLRWVDIAYQHDLLGKICAYLSPAPSPDTRSRPHGVVTNGQP